MTSAVATSHVLANFASMELSEIFTVLQRPTKLACLSY